MIKYYQIPLIFGTKFLTDLTADQVSMSTLDIYIWNSILYRLTEVASQPGLGFAFIAPPMAIKQ